MLKGKKGKGGKKDRKQERNMQGEKKERRAGKKRLDKRVNIIKLLGLNEIYSYKTAL